MDIKELSLKFGVNAEMGHRGNFPNFLRSIRGKKVLILCDLNTRPFSEEICAAIAREGSVERLTYPDREPVADERAVEAALSAGEGAEYLLAVGAGTLNDLAKRAGALLHRPCGILATAPSMDGFTSSVTPLIENGFKVTRDAQVVSDILLDYDLLSHAPSEMIGAGVGDILAKYCALADWELSARLTGETYRAEAVSLMRGAVEECEKSLQSLKRGEVEGIKKLMDALLISGYAMVIAGNSRPASGAEHHMSHFLEMDFLARNKRIPLHGIKVGLATAISLYLYHAIDRMPAFRGKEEVSRIEKGLPQSEFVLDILGSLHCPTRFSQLDISKDVFRRMLFESYKIRDRYTILTLYCKNGFMEEIADELIERFY